MRARERQDVVPDLSARTIPFDEESLLTRLGVIGERAVGKAVTLDRLLFIHDVHNAASVQPPESDIPGNDRHDLPSLDRRLGRPHLYPAQAELLPAPESSLGFHEDLLALSQLDPGVIHHIISRRQARCPPTAV